MTGRKYHVSLHAEINALFKSVKSMDKTNRLCAKKKDRPALSIYVVRLLKGAPHNGKEKPKFMFGNSKPCLNCQKYLAAYNITKIKYTDIIDGQNVLCEMRFKF
jgi:deoxycytidylate deaminase